MLNNKGLTLIELLVVIAILGALLGIVGLAVIPLMGEADLEVAQSDIVSYSSAVELWSVDQGGVLPDADTAEDGSVDEALGEFSDWNPDLAEGDMPVSEWGADLEYAEDGSDFVIWYSLDGFDGDIDDEDVVDGNGDDAANVIGGSVAPGAVITTEADPETAFLD